jgi:DNA-binding CsgD family transcriptional regulator
MPEDLQLQRGVSLRTRLRDAREKYFEVLGELDELTIEIRARAHGMVSPDGTHAIVALRNRKKLASEEYQAVIRELSASVRTPRPLAQTLDAQSPATRKPRLTPREVDVLDRLAQGMTSKEIANDLKISFKTAVTHRTHLMGKFEVGNTAMLIRRAVASGHIKP